MPFDPPISLAKPLAQVLLAQGWGSVLRGSQDSVCANLESLACTKASIGFLWRPWPGCPTKRLDMGREWGVDSHRPLLPPSRVYCIWLLTGFIDPGPCFHSGSPHVTYYPESDEVFNIRSEANGGSPRWWSTSSNQHRVSKYSGSEGNFVGIDHGSYTSKHDRFLINYTLHFDAIKLWHILSHYVWQWMIPSFFLICEVRKPYLNMLPTK